MKKVSPPSATTELPADLSAALKNAGLAAFFADCTPAHRREYLLWIGEAQQAATRKTRIEKTLKMLSTKHAEETARSK